MERTKAWIDVTDSYYSFEGKDQLTWSEYKQILDVFGILIYKAMLEQYKVVKLPHGIGNLYLKHCKVRRTSRHIDFKAMHTDGEIRLGKTDTLALDGMLKTTWDKRSQVTSSTSYTSKFVKFRPVRQAKKLIREHITKLGTLEQYHR